MSKVMNLAYQVIHYQLTIFLLGGVPITCIVTRLLSVAWPSFVVCSNFSTMCHDLKEGQKPQEKQNIWQVTKLQK